ncbi:hypothetical protein E2562_006012 [Oryza meyeriana var. granulata]|uniref:BHLH domain-containing protein n=1 Tax=Oryza meyeriana var. granulata TaxID=110450 RepID=A0A6G1EVA3_9ORYZ|nr:hypothetical protein E2562_006012 [Oryza meyeriana var. granulata]
MDPLREAASAEVEEKRRGGGTGGGEPPMFVFGSVGGSAARSETTTSCGAAASVRPRSCKPQTGAPSKNLMAERRRRKRLNNRLSMLRSVVPRISKMDRTSILGDTIGYVKELMDRIENLQDDAAGAG